MTREEAIKILKSKLDGSVDTSWEWTESVRMAIEALEMQDLCAEMLESAKDTNVLTKDLISRADAIDALGDEPDVWNDTDAEWAERDAWVMHKVAIEALPTADAVSRDDLIKAYEKGLQAQVVDLTESRPTGEWIKTEHCLNDTGYRRWIEIECPFCGERPTYEFLENMNYCPNCGAKMKGGTE